MLAAIGLGILTIVIPSFHYNLFSFALGFNPKKLKKGFPFQ